MIVTFDFGIFPTTLFVSSELNFDKLKESFAFETEDNGFVELSDNRFDSWKNANAVTVNVLEKETIKNGILVACSISLDNLSMDEKANTASHEAAHVIDKLYKYIGVQDGIDTEINAYLIGWVTKCIMSVVLSKKAIE